MTEVRLRDHDDRYCKLTCAPSVLEARMFPRQKPLLLVLIPTITSLMGSSGFRVQLTVM